MMNASEHKNISPTKKLLMSHDIERIDTRIKKEYIIFWDVLVTDYILEPELLIKWAKRLDWVVVFKHQRVPFEVMDEVSINFNIVAWRAFYEYIKKINA